LRQLCKESLSSYNRAKLKELACRGAEPSRSLLLSLPPDTAFFILEFLTCQDLCRLACTAKELKALATHPSHWRRLYVKDFHASQQKAPSTVELYTLQQHPRQVYIYRVQQRRLKVELARSVAPL
jgi:hypothetical protein